tara:strand:- start:432 stop:596 length:165 start_codon:yes stop_codon:yes gene_type:complete
MKECLGIITANGLIIKDFKSTKIFRPVLLVEFMKDLIFKKVIGQLFVKSINLKR